MKVKIISPEKKIYEGMCISVYVTTDVGDAEILEKHANFVAIIKGRIKIKEKEEKIREVDLQNRKALFRTDGEEVSIFVI
jgi:ATP synthase, Delta/Epsilon chain, beta-sandwich domain.